MTMSSVVHRQHCIYVARLLLDFFFTSGINTLTAMLQTQTKFTAPAGDDPVAIDFTGMGKGEAWVNGQSIGRYWPTNLAPQSGCVNSCNYRGAYSASKCLKKCGQPSQTL